MRALQAAKHACRASGWSISNLQLQKILYFAHMIYMGRTGQPLIDDESFEAWTYGPVLPSAYRFVSGFGSRPIADVFGTVFDSGDQDQKECIEAAVHRLGGVEPFRLVKMLHDERSAWQQYFDGKHNQVIPNSAVRDEYQRRFG